MMHDEMMRKQPVRDGNWTWKILAPI